MNEELTLSPAGLKLVQSFEGCERRQKGARFKAYVDPVGVLTIGWGHTNATGRTFDAATVWTQAECDAALRRICDPDAVSAQAFADQRRRIAEHGGREAIIARGDYGYTPAPGEKPAFAAR